MTLRIQTQLLPDLGCDLTIDLKTGRANVLRGENGIGKSTLLHHLAENVPETIFCEQRNPEHFFDRKLSVFRAILLKSSRLNRNLFDQFWEKAGFHQKSERMVKTLSGGEAQLLKLILHASAEGEIYLFDEPGQYLDPQKKELVSQLFRIILESGKCLVIVEHEPDWLGFPVELTTLVNKHGVLRRGGA